MPYIPKPRRIQLSPILDEMVHQEVNADGDLNYILFYYAKHHVPQSYNSLKNYLGELNEAAEEIRRRLLAPYEDKKRKENGDI